MHNEIPDRPHIPEIQSPEVMQQAVEGLSARVQGFFKLPGYIAESSSDDQGNRHSKYPAFTETNPKLQGKAFELFTHEDPKIPPTYRVTDGDKSWTWTGGAEAVTMAGPDNFSAQLSLNGIEELQGFVAEHRKVSVLKRLRQSVAKIALQRSGDTTKY